MEPRISIITIATDDLDRAARFYEAMGLKRHAGITDGVAFFQMGGAILGLFPRARRRGGLRASPSPGHRRRSILPTTPAPTQRSTRCLPWSRRPAAVSSSRQAAPSGVAGTAISPMPTGMSGKWHTIRPFRSRKTAHFPAGLTASAWRLPQATDAAEGALPQAHPARAGTGSGLGKVSVRPADFRRARIPARIHHADHHHRRRERHRQIDAARSNWRACRLRRGRRRQGLQAGRSYRRHRQEWRGSCRHATRAIGCPRSPPAGSSAPNPSTPSPATSTRRRRASGGVRRRISCRGRMAKGLSGSSRSVASGKACTSSTSPKARFRRSARSNCSAIRRMMTSHGTAQVIMATHSPLLMACPDCAAAAYQPRRTRSETDFRDTDHFHMMRDFCGDPQAFVDRSVA